MTRRALLARARWLDSERHAGYRLRPIPDDADRRIAALLVECLALPADGAASAAAGGLSEDRALVLKAFAERMATQAVRRGDDNAVFLGLAALALCVDIVDARELLIVLALLHDAAWRLDVPPASLTARLAPHFPNAARDFFHPFLARRDVDRSIVVMGFTASGSNEGFAYVPMPAAEMRRLTAAANEYDWPAREATEAVKRLLNLPATGHEQDWEIELADPARLDDILRALATTRDFETRCALALLSIAALEDAADAGPPDAALVRQARALIAAEQRLHDRMRYYWQMSRHSRHPTLIDDILTPP